MSLTIPDTFSHTVVSSEIFIIIKNASQQLHFSPEALEGIKALDNGCNAVILCFCYCMNGYWSKPVTEIIYLQKRAFDRSWVQYTTRALSSNAIPF